MTVGLRITDGTTTVTLTSDDALLLEYVPRTPGMDVRSVGLATQDGEEQIGARWNNVTEQAQVLITGGMAAARETLNKLNRLFEEAREFQWQRLGAQVWAEFRPAATEDWYRSELLSGKVEVDEEVLRSWYWNEGRIEAAVIWTRRYFWEGPEAELPLTNGNGSRVTGGLTVYNHDDADHDNYVEIAAEDVTGDTPGPVKLQMQNTFDSTARAAQFFVAHNVLSNPGSFDHILEGESASGGTNVTDTSCSGGAYKSVSWTGDSEIELLRWDLSTAFLNAAAGNYFRILARFLTAPSAETWLCFKIKMELTTIWEGAWIEAGSSYSLQDLDTLQLPPYLVGAGDLYPLKLSLLGKRVGGGSLYLDFLQMSPLDGWRKLLPKGYSLAYGALIVDDGISGYLYTYGWSPAGKTGHYSSRGQPLLLRPQTAQRLYFLHDTDSGSAPIERTLQVRAWYRPRRLVL